MTKQSINVGTSANDRKGDSLRAAFTKVNNNFDELYTALGLQDPTLNLGAFTFTGSTMSTDDSTNIVIDKPITVNGEIIVDGDILPKTNLGASIGSPTRQFKSLYVSNNTIYIGGTALSVNGAGNLTVNGSLITGGSVSSLVNSTKTVSLGSNGTLTVPAGGRISAASGYNLTLGDGLLLGQGGGIFNENEDGLYLGGQNSDAGTYIQIPGRTASENGEPLIIAHQWENASIDFSNYGGLWSFGSDGAFTIPNYGQLRPSSATYDAALAGWESFRSQEAESAALLGYTEAMRPFIGWRVNGGNVAAYLAELDRVWTIQNTGGATLVWTPAISSALRAQMRAAMLAVQNAYPSVGSDISIASGQGKYWNFSGDGTLTIPGDIKSNGNINIDINLSDSTLRRWQFGEDGNLAVPGDINLSGGTISQYSQNGLTGLKLVANADQGQNVTIMGTGNNTFPILNYVGTTLSGITIGTPEGDWNFMNGNLTIPGDIKSNGNINIDINLADSTLRRWQFGEDGDLILPVGGDIKNSTGTSVLGGSVSSLVNGAYTVSLSSAGVLTVPTNGIITAPIAQEFQLQAKDADSLLRNEINLDPNYGTYMSVWFDQTTSFSSSDWGSGSWNNEAGLGAARFTNAQALQDFWLTGNGSLGSAYEVSINGGARTPNVFYDGNNGGGSGVLLGVDPVPPGGPGTTVPITSLVFYYQLQSKINIDVNGGKILIDSQSMALDLRTTYNLDLRAGENLNLRGMGQYPVRVYTNDNTHMWEFGTNGSLTLPYGAVLRNTAGNAIAFGNGAGLNSQGAAAIAFGSDAGYYTQGADAVAIGRSAGEGYQGANAIAIGYAAGANNQAANSIVLNATGATLDQTTANTFTVAPIRNISATSGVLQYNASTKEVSYSLNVTAETFNTDQITVVGNRISTTVTNANLELECNGTGGVVINTVADATTASTVKSVGYLGLPQSATTTSGTLAIGDAGKHIYVTTTGQAIAIPDNGSVAYPIGTTLTFIAGPSATTVLIVINTDTLRLAGSSSTGTRTLAANGMATAVKVASTLWYINGIGLT